jgi:hypothetical protein
VPGSTEGEGFAGVLSECGRDRERGEDCAEASARRIIVHLTKVSQ